MFVSLKDLKSIFDRLDVAMLKINKERSKEQKEKEKDKKEFIQLIEECKIICLQDQVTYSPLELEHVTIAFNVVPLLIMAECKAIYINEGIKEIKIGLRKKLHMPVEMMVRRIIIRDRDIGTLDDLPNDLLQLIL